MAAISVVIPSVDLRRAERAIRSLAEQDVPHEVIVADNGTPWGERAAVSLRAIHPALQVMRLERNEGFSRAVNLAAARADGDALILLNDDCVVDRGFVRELAAALDPAAGIEMAAAVLRAAHDPGLIDTAGMQLDRTLLVFDYLNGEPLDVLESGPAAPVGPSAAAAAFDRGAFLAVGGFDERLFAYWEDVDLVLRLRGAGARCTLAPGALGTHEHSATLGSGSPEKNYLMGFGRGYVLRKWSVASPGRLAAIAARECAICIGQAAADRNLAGMRGRVRGFAAARREHSYPSEILCEARGDRLARTLLRRARRRARVSRG